MASKTRHLLEITSVSKTYGKGYSAIRAADDVSLAVDAGEIILIMGPSGSGKTTLLSIAGGLLGPDSGEISLSGETFSRLGEEGLSRLRLKQVGFVFQAFNLLGSLSALENVALVMNLAGKHGSSVEKQSSELLVRLGLEGRLLHLPADLSGGEKQRVAVARALANNPPIILADEPTGNLDSRSGRDLMMLLFELAREEGKAVVVVSHDQRIADIADRVLWLEDGQLSDKPPEVEHHVKDPVCGMVTNIRDAAFMINYKGRAFYFCSERCRDKFLERPEEFTG